jgi:sensor histidine kinase YesM
MARVFMLAIWTMKEHFQLIALQPPTGSEAKEIHPMINWAVSMNLLTDMLFCYCVAYWLWPRYLMHRKYLSFLLIVFSLAITAHFLKYILTDHPFDLSDSFSTVMWEQWIYFLRSGPMGVTVFFITLKLIKGWHLKYEERQTLSRENAQVELQLLKAQVHPHFLFNTLNSIYSFTLARSEQAADLVARLSDMMRYMVTSVEDVQVPLEKELKMIRDYITLEQVRYGSRLNLTFTIAGDTSDKLIAPMVMIPFVENAFKHGAGKTWPTPWIHLTIEIKDSNLYFQLDNSAPAGDSESNGKNGIGLTNIRKRLQLLYSEKHTLELRTLYDSFRVCLRVPLQETERPSAANETISSDKTQSLAYAR